MWCFDVILNGNFKIESIFQLLSNPQILICDEPTTGLDSYNAALVIQVLKKISRTGKIVVCSVHQPSSDIFNEFSDIMLMADGRLLLHGSQKECMEIFKRYDMLSDIVEAVVYLNRAIRRRL